MAEVLGLIGGTGFETLPAAYAEAPVTADTRFGPVPVVRATDGRREFVFVSRHGPGHTIPPHRIDYRANIAALAAMGVRRVLAANAVGSLRRDLEPGSLVLLRDFIDFTRARRPLSYWDDADVSAGSVVHTDFSQPYCPALRGALVDAAADLDIALLPRAVYLCTDGPRFETPAEVRLFAQWGADVVGMTGVPEAVFAREAGLCYAAVGIVANYGAGVTDEPVAHEEVERRVAALRGTVTRLMLASADHMPDEPACNCRPA